MFKLEIPNNLSSPWVEYSDVVKKLINQKDPKLRRRFRRLIPVERISNLANMLYALLSEENYNSMARKMSVP